jgi:hypothetical protein
MQFTPTPSNIRPDIAMGRGSVFREATTEYESINMNRPPPAPVGATPRAEMRGPQNADLDNILAGLKPKAPPTNINIHMEPEDDNDDSKISISSLKDLQNSTVPKKSGGNRRKQRSDKNVISLDI